VLGGCEYDFFLCGCVGGMLVVERKVLGGCEYHFLCCGCVVGMLVVERRRVMGGCEYLFLPLWVCGRDVGCGKKGDGWV
jgi:hypothetical protein